VTRFLSWYPHSSVEDTREVLNTWIKGYDRLNTYNWSIVPKEFGKVIGNICVIDFNDINERCEIGYCIGKEFWNKGITTEAFKTVINFLFNEVGVVRIQAKHDTDNVGSGEVMKKVGMTYEGTLNKYRKHKDGTFGNANIYGIFR